MKKTAGLAGGIAAAGLAGIVGLQAAAPAPGSSHAALHFKTPATVIVGPCGTPIVASSGNVNTVITSHTIHQSYQGVKGVTPTGQVVTVSGVTQTQLNGGFLFHLHANGMGVHQTNSVVLHHNARSDMDCTSGAGSQLASLASTRWAQQSHVSASAAAHAAPNSAVAQKAAAQTTARTAAPVAQTTTAAPTSPLFRQASTRGLQHSAAAPGLTHSSASTKAQPQAGTGTALPAGSNGHNGHLKRL